MRPALWIITPLCILLIVGGPPSPSAAPSQASAPLTLPAPPEPVGVPSVGAGEGDPALIADTLEKGLADKVLGRHVVAAVAPFAEGDVLFKSGTGTVLPASTMKLLTTTAALTVLGTDHTFETKVLLEPRSGAGPRTLVLVGGGDPLLARKPGDAYPERADVTTLAKRAAAALKADGVRRVRMRYDASLFSGPTGSPQWRSDYLTDDIVSPISALWIDEGREASGFGRVDDPALVAATAFANALRRAGIPVVGSPEEATARGTAQVTATVESAPLSQVVEHVLEVSDNEASEVLAHHVGLAVGGEGSFAGGARGVAATLNDLGVPLDGAAIYDGSGLSRANRLSAQTLVGVLQLATAADHPELRAVATGLPVAGFTGSLTFRFADAPVAGRGRVRAKTGTLTGVHGLAGLVTDLDDQTYVFMIVADKVALKQSLAARLAIDDLAATLAACHCGRT